jgi:hypothetical protein
MTSANQQGIACDCPPFLASAPEVVVACQERNDQPRRPHRKEWLDVAFPLPEHQGHERTKKDKDRHSNPMPAPMPILVPLDIPLLSGGAGPELVACAAAEAREAKVEAAADDAVEAVEEGAAEEFDDKDVASLVILKYCEVIPVFAGLVSHR